MLKRSQRIHGKHYVLRFAPLLYVQSALTRVLIQVQRHRSPRTSLRNLKRWRGYKGGSCKTVVHSAPTSKERKTERHGQDAKLLQQNCGTQDSPAAISMVVAPRSTGVLRSATP